MPIIRGRALELVPGGVLARVLALLLGAWLCLWPALAPAQTAAKPSPDWRYVESRLVKAGLRRAFIAEMKKTYEHKGFEDVLKLNVLLFLKKSDYHGPQVSGQAAGEVRQFMAANRAALKRAESEHKVPGQVIASLLWIESRHGKNLGKFHVPSVYLHLVQAERKAVVDHLQAQAGQFTAKVTNAQRKEIQARTKRKADWAMGELRALEKIHRRKWRIGSSMRGSFSGAFGMAQFLPSSYVRWARSQRPKAQPDLSRADDAIQSVAFYLRDHGWKASAQTHVPALMKYNNSRDYANAILTLANQVEAVPTGPVSQARAPAAKARQKPRPSGANR